ncbi:DUF736 domain-containing protein [Shinella sp. NM-101]|uniref:DUF736 domain-containing protein n=1 Tax=Shinella sp. NM-101 TaxID=2744455 RepID=UPI001F2F8169|nr:DUF736 domain-containing protein [Shinella sp. NM-101]
MRIGEFTRSKAGFVGRLRTLSIDAKLAIVPSDNAGVENAPDYRIHIGAVDGPEAGAGWKRTGERAGEYVSIALDDPLLLQPIRANLFRDDDGGAVWSLHWSRSPKRDGKE